MGDDDIDTVILDIDMGYLVTLPASKTVSSSLGPSTGSVMTKATVLAYRFLMASTTQGLAYITLHVI